MTTLIAVFAHPDDDAYGIAGSVALHADVIIDDAADVDRWRRIVTREWWTIAWPQRPPGAPMLNDLFAGP